MKQKEFFKPEPIRPEPKEFNYPGRLRKNHVRAQIPGSSNILMHNKTTESIYKRVLKTARDLHISSSDKTLKTVFEKDSRGDRSTFDEMEIFVSPCFYFRLSCDFLLYYQIEYAFYNCPFEDEI
uniref:hypothetical protein n=1 Tax=Rubrolithibacter danxiaensis TaxID=3390805 RepID=UPI003BF8DEF7